MIKSFQHKGLKAFFETGSKAGIQGQHATRLTLQLLPNSTPPQALMI
jgi:toxin HigB-1